MASLPQKGIIYSNLLFTATLLCRWQNLVTRAEERHKLVTASLNFYKTAEQVETRNRKYEDVPKNTLICHQIIWTSVLGYPNTP